MSGSRALERRRVSLGAVAARSETQRLIVRTVYEEELSMFA
jgi:hypothetical protein